MKERPILFSGPMVRAILEGRKTQTRRVIRSDWWLCLEPEDAEDRARALTMCPFGSPGDRLWVRETWRAQPASDCSFGDAMRGTRLGVVYAADGAERIVVAGGGLFGPGWNIDYRDIDYPMEKWGINRPSIHMPRWASRLTLEVVAVRVERLQEISEADAMAEGIAFHGDQPSPRDEFSELWDAINGKRAPWASNQWVWVVEFKVVA